MATGFENATAAWAAVDTAANALSAQVRVWIDEINRTANEGLTGAQTEALITNMTNHAAALTALGASTANPIPPIPTPVPMPGPFRDGSGQPGQPVR